MAADTGVLDAAAVAVDAEGEVVGEGLPTGLADGSGLAEGAEPFTADSLLPGETFGEGASLGLDGFGPFVDAVEPVIAGVEVLNSIIGAAFTTVIPLVELFGCLRRDSLPVLAPAFRVTPETVAPRTAERRCAGAGLFRGYTGGAGPTESRMVLALVRLATSLESVRGLALEERVGIEKTISIRFNFRSMRAVVPGCK